MIPTSWLCLMIKWLLKEFCFTMLYLDVLKKIDVNHAIIFWSLFVHDLENHASFSFHFTVIHCITHKCFMVLKIKTCAKRLGLWVFLEGTEPLSVFFLLDDDKELCLRAAITGLLVCIQNDKEEYACSLQLLDKTLREMPGTKHRL